MTLTGILVLLLIIALIVRTIAFRGDSGDSAARSISASDKDRNNSTSSTTRTTGPVIS